jgi:hypothetical protein
MRLWVLILILAASAPAQHRGGGRGGFGGGSHGGGGIRGGGFSHFGGFRGGGIVRGGGFYGGRGYIHSGFRYGGYPWGSFGYFRGGYRSGFGFGVGWPYYGSYWGYTPLYNSYSYAPSAYDWYAPNVYAAPPVVIVGPDYDDDRRSSRGPVVINNGPVRDWRDRDYSAEPGGNRTEQRDESGPITYLIALNDGRIWAVVAYWTEGTTLRIVTRQKERMDLPLDQVDRAYSERLNRERGVPFRLP